MKKSRPIRKLMVKTYDRAYYAGYGDAIRDAKKILKKVTKA